MTRIRPAAGRSPISVHAIESSRMIDSGRERGDFCVPSEGKNDIIARRGEMVNPN